jgi:hypothetical protein
LCSICRCTRRAAARSFFSRTAETHAYRSASGTTNKKTYTPAEKTT